MVVSGPVQTRYLCCFKLNMVSDQSIKNKTLALETDTAYDRYMVDWHVSARKSLFLQFCIYFRKPLRNLFVVDRILFGWLRPEDIQYCHSWKLKTAGNFFWLYQWQYFLISIPVLQCIVLTNIVSSARVSLSKKLKNSKLKESIDFRVRTER